MNDCLDALLQLLPLDRLPRSGWVQGGVPNPESIAGHILGVSHLALALGPRVEPPLDMARLLTLCLVHDAPEAWLGDIPKRGSELLPAGSKASAEHSAAGALLSPLSPDLPKAFWDYQAGDSPEARLAKVCDKLQLGIQLYAYLRAGQRGLKEFVETVGAVDCGEFAVAEEFKRALVDRIGQITD
jgi:putative hydrolases of HD superfamily